MNRDLVLVIDCDGLIFNSNGLIEEGVRRVNYKASDAYADKLLTQHSLREKVIFSSFNDTDRELVEKLLKEESDAYQKAIMEYRITKDEVLEEVFPIYKNKINYHKIYQKENLFPGVCETINFLNNIGRFKKIYICTQYNSKKEMREKKLALAEVLPGIEVVFVPFHDVPYIYDRKRYYDNAKRRRTNKALYFQRLTGEALSKTIILDDSAGICSEARDLGCKAFYRNPKSNNPIEVFNELDEYLMGDTEEFDYEEHIEKCYQKALRRNHF